MIIGGMTSDASPAIRLRRGTVARVEAAGAAVRLEVALPDEDEPAPAIAYPALTGVPEVGDVVVVNTTARTLGLGTGGLDLVVAVEGRVPPDPGPGARTMKARYLPHQVAVRSVEEDHPEALGPSATLSGVPVVAAPLHSLVAPIAAGARAAGARRIAYVMTDGAALPAAFSDLLRTLRGSGFVDASVTVGQAFGGDLEAVTLWSGLLAAVTVADAEVVIVADGPGNLGTATTWGVSALASGLALNAARLLGGSPVAALRISFADPRPRHRGLSHHSRTILGEVCTVEANVAVPVLEGEQRSAIWEALRAARLEERHQLVEADGRPALDALADAGVTVRSMGRSAEDDPAFFLAGGAAGVLAARMAVGGRRWRPDVTSGR